MEVTIRGCEGEFVVVVRIAHADETAERQQRPERTSWTERRFADALDVSAALSATPSIRAVR